ncbi:hypothetical protein [Halobacterium litoreum]|uniref:Uncharacterized protein n=1 Tax=Halobacterium litoreum TaxID=2039234 RepID=A0ABD5N934_9EURY|nr:hypothetical protein [Halobacterium litoreum]UHH14885.1 hypothetical protein LT972_14730 [Halobacterium litoreum]
MTRTVDLRDLSRAQRREYDTDRETVAEELVAEVYGARHRPDREDWFDVVDEDASTKYEVKSTSVEIGDEYPAPGRFRLWRAQLRSLIASDAGATAWVAFVLFDEDAGRAVIQRRRPSTVWNIVDRRGGWNESGHEDWGRQHKLPFDEVVDRA